MPVGEEAPERGPAVQSHVVHLVADVLDAMGATTDCIMGVAA